MDKKITLLAFGFLSFFSVIGVSHARMADISPSTDRFEQKIDFTVEGITTPKVVTFETSQRLGNFQALQNSDNGEFIHFEASTQFSEADWGMYLESISETIDGRSSYLQDQKTNTSVTFDSNNQNHIVTFDNTEARYLISEIDITLSSNTIPPDYVSIRAMLPGSSEWKTIIDQKRFSSRITFPKIQPQKIEVILESNNLLRVSEIDFSNDVRQKSRKERIHFYASEGQNYTLFTQPSFGQERISGISTQGLRTDNNTPVFDLPQAQKNEGYNPDFDLDGINDLQDLCPKVADETNADIDGNQRGDVCEDPDQDYYFSHKDNCPFVYNPDQKDSDADGLGDKCDESDDRTTEKDDLLITISFIVMVLALIFLITKSALNMKKESQNTSNEDDEE